jgi:hypothetical protein
LTRFTEIGARAIVALFVLVPSVVLLMVGFDDVVRAPTAVPTASRWQVLAGVLGSVHFAAFALRKRHLAWCVACVLTGIPIVLDAAWLLVATYVFDEFGAQVAAAGMVVVPLASTFASMSSAMGLVRGPAGRRE